jgi:hypothetical protein
MTVFVMDTNVISDIVAPSPISNVLVNLVKHRQDTLFYVKRWTMRSEEVISKHPQLTN